MRFYNWENKISMDECALLTRDLENESIANYRTFNYFNFDNFEQVKKQLNKVAWDNPNLRYRDGYGVANSHVIDMDSKFRYEKELTNSPYKRQYYVRNFTAVPDFSRGTCAPVTESILKNGQDTSQFQYCNIVSETNFNRFIPFVPCFEKYMEDVSYNIPDMQTIGINSRDIVRRELMTKKCKEK